MKHDSIKALFKPFELIAKRKTTINQYFAKAIATTEPYDEKKVLVAIKALGMNSLKLQCVYCEKSAEGWDHVKSIVKKGRFSGYGNTLGNLVPSCRKCNSLKAAKDWKEFMMSQKSPAKRIAKLERYFKTFRNTDAKYKKLLKTKQRQVNKFYRLQDQVVELMAQADKVAKKLRH